MQYARQVWYCFSIFWFLIPSKTHEVAISQIFPQKFNCKFKVLVWYIHSLGDDFIFTNFIRS